MAQLTMQQMLDAMMKADQAGDAEGARVMAGMIQRAQAEQRGAEQEAEFQRTLEEQAEAMPWHEVALVGAGKTFTDIGRGAQNLWYGLTGDEQAQEELRQRAEEEERLYDPLRRTRRGATFAGEMLPYLATAPLGGGAGVARRTASKAAEGFATNRRW